MPNILIESTDCIICVYAEPLQENNIAPCTMRILNSNEIFLVDEIAS